MTTLDASSGETRHMYPFFLPDGRHFLYLALGQKDGPNSANGVYVASIDSPERKLLVPAGSNAQYAQGYLLFLQETTLIAQPFDSVALEVRGEAQSLAERVRIGGGFGGPFSTSGGFAVSESGALAYNAGASEPQTELVWLDRTGHEIGVLGEPGSYLGPELSPDGTRAAVTVTNVTTTGNDIWLFDLRGVRTRLTFDGGSKAGQIWSPDGDRIAFRASGTLDLAQKSRNGSRAVPCEVEGRVAHAADVCVVRAAGASSRAGGASRDRHQHRAVGARPRRARAWQRTHVGGRPHDSALVRNMRPPERRSVARRSGNGEGPSLRAVRV